MTVLELIEELQQLNPDAPVLLSTDQEGNLFRPIFSVEGPNVIEEDPTSYSIDMILSVDDFDTQEEFEDALARMSEVVVIWP